MTSEEQQQIRFECLVMAVETCGADVAYDYVLECADKYVKFVFGLRPVLSVVRDDE